MKSYEESLGDKIDEELAPKCLNSELSIDQQFSLCEAIKVNAFQSEDNGKTISSTLLLIKVLFEDLRLGFEIHQQFKKIPQKTLILMEHFFLQNWTSTKQGGYTLFANQLQKNDGIDPIKKSIYIAWGLLYISLPGILQKNTLHLCLHASKKLWKRIIGPNANFENVQTIG